MQALTTTGPINTGTTWTSLTTLSNTADTITGSVFADQSGHLFVEQSSDGTNWDISTDHTVTASTALTINDTIYLPWIRARFNNNSGSNQTVLRVHLRFSSAGVVP